MTTTLFIAIVLFVLAIFSALVLIGFVVKEMDNRFKSIESEMSESDVSGGPWNIL